MQLRLTSRMKVLGVAALMVALAGGAALASNMGFKHNHQVIGPPGGGFQGLNIVSVPFNNPFATAEDYCNAQGLTGASGTVIRSDGTNSITHICGGGAPFALVRGEGLFVTNPSTVNGILVGAHVPTHGHSFTGPPGAGFVGLNLYSVPYHTTNANAEDVCLEFGLTAAQGTVIRGDGTNSITHICGGGAPFALVLGEGLIVTNPTPVGPVVPSHF